MESSWDHLRSSGIIWDHFGSSVIILDHLGLSGAEIRLIWGHLKCSARPIWHHLGSSGTIWGHLGSAWVICSHLGSSELIWAQKLQYLSAKMQNSMFFVNFMRCFGGQVHQVLYLPRGPTTDHNLRQPAANQLEHQMVLKNSTRTLIEIK